MKEREIGSMQVAGEKIRITEVPPEDHEGHIYMYASSPLLELESRGASIVSKWVACLDDNERIAWGSMVEDLKDEEGVILSVVVLPKRGRLGLGRLMIRIGTDQAIRYRKRTILTEVENTNEAALKILDEEDFEKQPEQHPGFTLLRKELKWI